MKSAIQTNPLQDSVPHSDVQEALSRLKLLWEKFTEDQTVTPEDLRPGILDSWQRSHSQKIDPHTPNPSILPAREVKARVRANNEIIDVVQLVIACADELIGISNHVVAFVDRDGIILKIHGNPDLTELLGQLSFLVGADWSEPSAGTTAVGMTLKSGQPSHVLHAEHFCERLQEFSCTAVPIHDPISKEIIGLLDFVAFIEDHQPHVTGIALQMARIIELEIYRNRKEQDDFFRDCSIEVTLNQMEKGVLVLDDEDRIRRVNLKALEYLNLDSNGLSNVNNMKFSDLAAISEWQDPERPFVLARARGSKVYLKRKPLVHQKRLIGSLILIESDAKNEKRATPASVCLPETPLGKSPAFNKVLFFADKAARCTSNVLILGKTGTGKEVIARYIHEKSPQYKGHFVAVNCGSIPRELLGSELFGYEAGAFTGAKQKGHRSKFEQAQGGTLLLDEISEMPLDAQVYLLRVIEDRAVTRLGGTRPVPVDIRLIAASNKDLRQEADEGRFRLDLLFRLNVLGIDLPLLKERKEDIPLLVDHFIKKLSESFDMTFLQISEEAMAALVAYDWPGNIRELRNVVEQAMVMSPDDTIGLESLPGHIGNAGGITSGVRSTNQDRYLQFVKVYQECQGNISQVSKILDVSRPTVYAWKKKYGL